MKAAEIVGRGVAFDMETNGFVVTEALTRTILYYHADDLEADIPLETVETGFLQYYDGDPPQEIEEFIDFLDEPWSTEEVIQDL